MIFEVEICIFLPSKEIAKEPNASESDRFQVNLCCC